MAGAENRNYSRLVFAVCVFFCFVSSYRIGAVFEFYPVDDIFKYLISLKALAIISGSEKTAVFSSIFADTRMPFIMYTEHVGSPWLYATVPMIWALGPVVGTFAAYKLVMVVAGLVILLSVFFVLSVGLCRRTAALTVFFLATNYVYVHSVRIGFYREEILQIAGLWAGFALCLVSVRNRKEFFLFAGFFVFGLALWAKIMFFGYMGSFVFGMLFVQREWRRALFEKMFSGTKKKLLAVAGFTAGCAPMIYFNYCYGFPIFRHMLNRFLFAERFCNSLSNDWNNWHLWSNLNGRIGHVIEYLSGTLFVPDFFNGLSLVLYVWAFCWGLWAVFFHKDGRVKNWLRFLFPACGLLLLLTSCFLPYGVSNGHILVLVPVFELLLALAVVSVLKNISGDFLRKGCFVGVLLLWLCGHGLNYWRFNDKYFVKGAFWGVYASERDELAEAFRRHRIRDITVIQPLASVVRSCSDDDVNILSCIDFYEGVGLTSAFLERPDISEVYLLVSSVDTADKKRRNKTLRLPTPGLACNLLESFCFRAREDCTFELYCIRKKTH